MYEYGGFKYVLKALNYFAVVVGRAGKRLSERLKL